MKICLKNPVFDIAPLEGRNTLNRSQLGDAGSSLTWEGSFCSIAGEYSYNTGTGEQSLRLQGTIHPKPDLDSYSGWIELETLPGPELPTPDTLYLAGTRPLPGPNITCISRHPLSQEYLVAATSDGWLLVLDARLPQNMRVLSEIKLAVAIISITCCGDRLLGLTTQQTLEIIETDDFSGASPVLSLSAQVPIPVPLTALAENDAYSAWGMTTGGEVYYLPLHNPALSPPNFLGRSEIRKTSLSFKAPSPGFTISKICLAYFQYLLFLGRTIRYIKDLFSRAGI